MTRDTGECTPCQQRKAKALDMRIKYIDRMERETLYDPNFRSLPTSIQMNVIRVMEDVKHYRETIMSDPVYVKWGNKPTPQHGRDASR